MCTNKKRHTQHKFETYFTKNIIYFVGIFCIHLRVGVAKLISIFFNNLAIKKMSWSSTFMLSWRDAVQKSTGMAGHTAV